MSTPVLSITFHGDLTQLLRRVDVSDSGVNYPLTRRASIKDIIESFGIPHTEIGAVLRDGRKQPLTFIPEEKQRLDVYPHGYDGLADSSTSILPTPPGTIKFLVDINVARLARSLRMAGFNASMVSGKSLNKIAATATKENRIILTRNRDLLKLKAVVYGRLIRNEQPEDQLSEVVCLYSLQHEMRPFSRCMSCNGLLEKVNKNNIEDRLLPLTQKYYSIFMQCKDCDKIYWRGSHHEKMVKMLNNLVL